MFGLFSKPHIRAALSYDLPEMAEIEMRVRGGPDPITPPWDVPRFSRYLDRVDANIQVAEVGREIAAYICYEYGDRRIEVANLVVDPDHRRRGIGRQLLARPLSRLTPGTFRTLVADADEYETTAHLFLRACGLRARIVHGEDGARDLYRFVRHAIEMGDELAAQNCPGAGETVP